MTNIKMGHASRGMRSSSGISTKASTVHLNRILLVLRENKSTLFNKTELREKTGMNISTIRSALSFLIKEGIVQEDLGHNNSVRRYRIASR